MLRKPLFWETFILLAAMGIFNYIAVERHLYWSMNEFDSFVHFLGGATLSSFFLWLYFYSGAFSPSKRNLLNFIFISLIGAMAFSVLWEIFELVLGEVSIQKEEYPFDTALDFAMDFLGAAAVTLYGYLKELKLKLQGPAN